MGFPSGLGFFVQGPPALAHSDPDDHEHGHEKEIGGAQSADETTSARNDVGLGILRNLFLRELHLVLDNASLLLYCLLWRHT